MRQIVLDTETTGLDPSSGHRVVEVACLELMGGEETGRVFHHYINPAMPMPPYAQEIHGLSDKFLSDKPAFSKIVDDLIGFMREAELVIHNAPFDLKFINHELTLAGKGKLADYCPTIVDTLLIAKDKRPGKKNTLDALCQNFEIDISGRSRHGALIDVHLLAKVYEALRKL